MENSKDIKKLLGSRIAELRNKKKLSQEKLAEQLGIYQKSLSKIECGKIFISADTLSKLLIALDVEPKDLFDFKHNEEKAILKQELLTAIETEAVDLKLMYRFYQSIK